MSKNCKNSDLLKDARALVERRWIQGQFNIRPEHRVHNSTMYDADDYSAPGYCILGSITQIVRESSCQNGSKLENIVKDVLPKSFSKSIAAYNDKPGRSKKYILRLFDKAIAAAAAAEAQEG